MSIATQWASGFGFASRPGTRGAAARRLRRAGVIVAALVLVATAPAQEGRSGPASTPPAGTGAHPPVATPDGPDGLNRTAPPSDAEVAALRAEVTGQLQAIAPSAPPPVAAGSAPSPSAAAQSASDKPLRELLQERLRLLDEYNKAASAFKKASIPEPSPEKRGDEVKSELARLEALLAQAGRNPDVLLPQTVRTSDHAARPSVDAEMKEAIEAATGDLKDAKAKLEALQAEVTNGEVQQNARRAERDKLFQAVAAAKAQGTERAEPAAPAKASGPAQRLAHERQLNAAWKARVAAMRLRAVEAQVALEAKMAGVREVSVQAVAAQVRVAEKTLALLQSRYSAAAEQQERLLKARAAAEESAASRSVDPLEQFCARRRAALLDLEAQVVKNEQVLATSPAPSLDEQRGLADRAEADFARVKTLLDDGRVSRLDAIRLNNDFRRIGPERDRLLRNEMARAELRLQYYEDMLTRVELDLLQDSLHDRYELEVLKESLPSRRWAEGEGALAELERHQRALLVRRRKVLEQLSDGTAQTLDQISRRLATLDEEYAFIRTHIFWVRDREPIGPAIIRQGAREAHHVLKALVRLGQDSARPGNWGRTSAEFVAAALAALGLPIGLVRIRRMIRSRIARDLPPGRPKAA